jgi:hypothetical protein
MSRWIDVRIWFGIERDGWRSQIEQAATVDRELPIMDQCALAVDFWIRRQREIRGQEYRRPEITAIWSQRVQTGEWLRIYGNEEQTA